MNAINELSATKLISLIKTKTVSVSEVMEVHLNRIAEINPIINAIVQHDPEKAMDEAKTMDTQIAKKNIFGRLQGLPITVKNVCHVKGFAPDKGCQGLAGQKSSYDATIVKRMRHEGAIILGLTNTPELTLGYETDNLMYGRTLNPYHLDFTPGGSSGGEAAAIAAACSPLGIASDGGGSIRVPAHYSGVAGLRATQGLIPFTGNIPFDGAGLFSQFISFGPMARCVHDLCLSLPIIAGPDGRDPHVFPVPLKDPSKVKLSNLNVAFYTHDGVSLATDSTVLTIKAAVSQLENVVKDVHETQPVHIANIYDLLNESIFLGGDRGEWLNQIFQQLSMKTYSPLLAEFIALAQNCEFTVTNLRQRWVEFDQFRIKMLDFFESYDVLICPVSATPAKKHGMSFKEIRDMSYVLTHTLTGWPTVVIPFGSTEEGLPIGVQIVAKPWMEDIALAVALYLENCYGGWRKPLFLSFGQNK